MKGQRGLIIAAAGVLLWLFVGTLFYYLVENCSDVPRITVNGEVITVSACPWTFGQAFYFSVQTGLSIGFGLLSESQTASMAYSIFHILAGSSFIGGALALFASLALTRSKHFQSAEERTLATASAKLHADGYAGFKPGELHDLMVSYPHYTNAILRKMDKDPASAAHRIKEFAKADSDKRSDLAAAILKEATEKLPEFQTDSLSIKDLTTIAEQNSSRKHKILMKARQQRNLIVVGGSFFIWIAIGTIFSVVADHNDFVTGLYFAISSLSTAGMVAVKTVDSQAHVVFAGIFCLIGVPLYCTFLGMFANILVDRYNAKQVEAALHAKFSAAEAEFLEHISSDRHKDKVNEAEYIEIQCLRLGLVDRDLLRSMREQFRELDKDKTGYVKKEDFMPRVQAVPPAEAAAAVAVEEKEQVTL